MSDELGRIEAAEALIAAHEIARGVAALDIAALNQAGPAAPWEAISEVITAAVLPLTSQGYTEVVVGELALTIACIITNVAPVLEADPVALLAEFSRYRLVDGYGIAQTSPS